MIVIFSYKKIYRHTVNAQLVETIERQNWNKLQKNESSGVIYKTVVVSPILARFVVTETQFCSSKSACVYMRCIFGVNFSLHDTQCVKLDVNSPRYISHNYFSHVARLLLI